MMSLSIPPNSPAPNSGEACPCGHDPPGPPPVCRALKTPHQPITATMSFPIVDERQLRSLRSVHRRQREFSTSCNCGITTVIHTLRLLNSHALHNRDIDHPARTATAKSPWSAEQAGPQGSTPASRPARPAHQGHRPPCTRAFGESRWPAEQSGPLEKPLRHDSKQQVTGTIRNHAHHDQSRPSKMIAVAVVQPHSRHVH